MSEAFDVGPLIRRLEADLEAEFPGWRIVREVTGRWSAVLAGWGVLYGQSAAELRDRLRQHTRGATDER